MSHAQILSDLTQIFREVFDDDALVITEETTAKDVPGWDSFMHINLIVACEKFFRVKFKTAEIESLQNVGSLIAVIEAKLSK
jgi:acyl carrier protein